MSHQSVYTSLTKLCDVLVQSDGFTSHLERSEKHALVKKLRTNAFAVLLKKCASSILAQGLPREQLDTLVRLRFHTLSLQQRGLQDQADRLHCCVDSVISNRMADNPVFMTVLLFLMSYIENSMEEALAPQDIFQNHLNEFKLPFNNSYTNVRPYREFLPEMFMPSHRFLQQKTPQTNYASYQFLPANGDFPFSMEPGTDLPLLSRFIRRPKVQSLRYAMHSNSETAYTIPELSSPRGLQIPKLFATSQELMKDEGYGTPSQEFADVEEPSYGDAADKLDMDIWDHAQSPATCDLHTWETVGEVCPGKEPGFLYEVAPEDLRHLCMVQELEQLHTGDASLSPGQPMNLPRALLISHLKYLATGIESTTFFYNQAVQVFEMDHGICMEGMSARTFSQLCENFLACGTSFRRLYDLVCTDKPVQGLVYQAACRSARAYLVLYRHVVLGAQTLSLARLSALVEAHTAQLACLGECLHAGPAAGQLLARLCHLLRVVSRPDLICLLCSLLLTCCQAYFSFVEKWILDGACNDVYGEFFIQAVAEFQHSGNRSYWSKGFALNEGEIPSFLQGLQDSILQCAKTVALLKLCNPKDPLCMAAERGHPRMRCCVTKDSLALLEAQFRQYEASCRLLCGKPVSILQLLQCADLDVQAIEQAQRNRLLSIERERESQVAAARDRKQQLLAEQQLELELLRAHRRQQQAQREADDARLQALEQHEQQLLQLERKALVEYYDALSEVAEKRVKDAETIIEKTLELQDNARRGLNTRNVLPSPNNNSQESVLNLANIVHMTNREEIKANDNTGDPIITTPNGNIYFPDLNSNSLTVTQHNENLKNSNAGVDLICHKLDVSPPFAVVSNINVHAAMTHNIVPASPQKRHVPNNLPLCQEKLATHVTTTHMPELSEAQRNKRKVLYEEFGMGGEVRSEVKHLRQKNNTNITWAESDLERNRNRVLQSSIGIGVSTRECSAVSHPLGTTSGAMVDTSQNIHGNSDSEAKDEITTQSLTSYMASAPHDTREKLDEGSGVPTKHYASGNGNTDLSSAPDAQPDESTLQSRNRNESHMVQCDDPAEEAGSSLLQVKSSLEAADPISEGLKGRKCFEEMQVMVDITGKMSATHDLEHLEQESLDMFFVMSALRKSLLIPLKIQAQLANSQLLRHLLVECDLLSHLHSLHRFFFLLDGEFCHTMSCDLFEHMYRAQRPSDLLNIATLGAVLAKALSVSSTSNGSHLTFSVSAVPDVFKHASPSVLGSLSLHYHVSWPLNIVITDASLEKYNLVFGFLLKLRRISWVMEQDFHWLKSAWLAGQVDRAALLTSPQYHRLQLWRHDMMHFVCALQHYLLGAIHHESWAQFQHSLQSAHTLDQLYRLHSLYVREVLQRCFLDNKSQSMQTALQNLCRVVLKFHGMLRGKQWVRKSGERCYQHPAFDRLRDTYRSFRHLCNFVYRLSVKIATRGYQTHIFCLLQALNMNDYYSEENQVEHGCDNH